MGFRRAAFLAFTFLTIPVLAAAAPLPAETPVAAGAAPELTVYPGDLALVRERRTFRLTGPETRLAFTGVSRQLRADTVALSVETNQQVKASDVRLLDQTFAYNVVSQQSLLEQSVDKEVSVVSVNPATGREQTERAKIVAVQNGVVLDMGGRITTEVPGRLVFDGIPPNLRAQPTLLVTAAGPVGKDVNAQLSYLTGGLGWHANYVVRYDSEGGRLDLSAWATVDNNTGLDFKDAKLKLAAGEVNIESPQPRPYMAKAMRAEMAAAAAPAPMDASAPESLENLQLYTIMRPTTLANGESKQLMLLQLINVPVKRDVVVRGQPWQFLQPMPGKPQVSSAEVEITLKNEAAKPQPKGSKEIAPPSGLGQPLPAGIVRAYGEDDDGRLQFLGEDRTNGATAGEDLKLRLGHDADLPVTREQVSFVRANEAITVSAWRIMIRNGKSKPLPVRVEEPVSGNWDIIRENIPHTKNEAGLPQWTLTIPPKGRAVLEYSVRAGTGLANPSPPPAVTPPTPMPPTLPFAPGPR